MKKELLALLSLSSFLVLSASAQIIYEYDDIPVIGDNITRYRDTMTVYGPGPSGGGQQWSFPAPVTHETITTNVITPASTPHASTFTASNMAMTNDNSAFLYFSNSQSAMISTGAAGDLLGNGGNIVTVFNPTLTAHNFPRQFESTSDGEYYFEVETENHGIPLVHSVRLHHYGHVYDTTDGYGQITTPVGTYDCLRVKATDHTVDSVWMKLFFFSEWELQDEFTGADTSISYSWLAKETKLAVAELSYDAEDNPKNFIWSSIPPLTTAIADAGQRELHVYPQPAKDMFTVELPENVSGYSLELLSLDGRTVRVLTGRNMGRVDIPCTGLAPGMYVLRLLSTDDQVTFTRKVVVQ